MPHHEPSDLAPHLAQHGMFTLVHRSLQGDLAKLEQAVDDLTLGDRVARGRKMDHWFRGFAKIVRHHHRIEHELFWSALPGEMAQEGLRQLVRDFEVLDAALDAVRKGFWSFRHLREFVVPQAELVQLIREAREALATYLEHEEALLVAPFRAHFVAQEFPKVHPRIVEGLDLGGVAFAVPWALGGLSDEERRELLPQVPLALRMAYRATQLWYQRKAAALDLWSPRSLRIPAT